MPRKPKRIPQTITEEQLRKIILEIGKTKNKFLRVRNVTLILLSYYLGLRPKEARAIRMSDINFEEQTLFIPAENNKQRNSDVLPLPDFICLLLQSYIKQKPESAWLFPSSRKTPLGRNTHMRLFRRAVKSAGLLNCAYIDGQGKNRYSLTLYSLRHSFGTLAYQKIKDIPKVAVLLRHYDFQYRTTLRYVHTANVSKRKELMEEMYG